MLLYRVLSAAIGIPLLLWVSYMGGNIFAIAVGLIILLALFEYGNMVGAKGHHVSSNLMYFSGVVVVLGFVFREYFGLLIFLILCAHLFVIIFKGEKPSDAAVSFFGVFYVAWSLGHLILMRENLPFGFGFVVLSFFITWATDTGAYFTGRFFGKHKLSPKISPKKTVEGAVGGIVICVLVVAIFANNIFYYPVGILILLGILASIAGQLGDLAESGIKRWAGVKDSGSIIPGHGGVLDRFDSLILAAPLVYYFVSVFII